VTNYVLNACATADCSSASFVSALNAIGDDKPVLKDDSSLAALRIAYYFMAVERIMSGVMDSREKPDVNRGSTDPLQVEKDLVTSGITQCLLAPDAGRELSERLVRIRDVSSSSAAIQWRIGDPTFFIEMTSKYPQTNSNTRMDIVRLVDITNASGTDTFEEFTHALGNDLAQAMLGLQALDTDCRSTLDDDSRALKAMASGVAR